MLRAKLFWQGFGTGCAALLLFVLVLMKLMDISLLTKSERAIYIQVVSDTPPPKTFRDYIISAIAPREEIEPNQRIREAITQRLYIASEMLALAKSNTWSLATWAQLEWVRKTLDGNAPFHSKNFVSVFPDFEDYSFKRLLNEFSANSRPSEVAAAAATVSDGADLVALLSGVSAETKNPESILSTAVDKIQNAKGLHIFVNEFPKYKTIEMER